MPQKSWTIGEEVLAADFNTYVQDQVVPQFANTTERDAQWLAPPDGAMCTTVDTGRRWQRIGGLWWRPNALIARAERTTTAGPQGVEADISGMTITATYPANRRVRVEAGISRVNADGDTVIGMLRIKEGSTDIYEAQFPVNALWAGPGCIFGKSLVPSAGAHTYKMTIQGISGLVHIYADATSPIWLEAWDMGGA